jgi:membrane associated rhomboid family serine protease
MGPVTRALILANVAVYLLGRPYRQALETTFALWPVGHYAVFGMQKAVGFEPWQLVTYSFLHANFTHIFLNLFALYMFGRDVEKTLGPRRYCVLYFAAVLTAALVQLVVVSSNISDQVYPTVGASGGVFGVLLAFAYLYPHGIVTLLFPPIPMKAWLFVTLYGIIELVSGVFGTASGIAHFAHLGGMLGAFAVLRWFGPIRR